MSNILDAASAQGRTAPVARARHKSVTGALAAMALLSLGVPVKAAIAPQAYCIPEVARVSAEWNAIGFDIPQKPSQQIVESRSGLTGSGPEVIFIRNQIRQAIWDCQHGYVEAARERAALAAAWLDELR